MACQSQERDVTRVEIADVLAQFLRELQECVLEEGLSVSRGPANGRDCKSASLGAEGRILLNGGTENWCEIGNIERVGCYILRSTLI